MFKRRFFICLLLTLPVLYFSPMFQHWFGYQAIQFPGANWGEPILAAIIYFYGGWVFLRGAWYELRSKIGMMTLITLAITVAFVYIEPLPARHRRGFRPGVGLVLFALNLAEWLSGWTILGYGANCSKGESATCFQTRLLARSLLMIMSFHRPPERLRP